MSTPLVNHRPLKGKEDGIYNIACTSTRTNPANYLKSFDFTAISLILPLKDPLLGFSCNLGFKHYSYLTKILFDRQVIKVSTICRRHTSLAEGNIISQSDTSFRNAIHHFTK